MASVSESIKRVTKPSMKTFQSQLQSAEETLLQSFEFDLSEIQDQPEQLRAFSFRLKQNIKDFNDASRSVSTRFIEIGSPHSSHEVRQHRLNLQKETSEIKFTIENMLKNLNLDGLSSWDLQSVRSGFSLSSQLQVDLPIAPPLRPLSPDHTACPF